MRAALAITVSLVLIGCDNDSRSGPKTGPVQTPTDSHRVDDHESSGAASVSRVFGIANEFSGKLTEEEEKSVPKALQGAFYVESVRQITTAELENELKFKTLIAKENHDGNRYVAVKDFRHVQFSDEVSGQMPVIERYLVVPN